MAAGDVKVFNSFGNNLGKKIHEMSTDTFKIAFVTSSVTPAQADAVPHFGGTGTTNYATNQVAAGGNYASGGATLTSTEFNAVGGVSSFKAAKFSIAQHASNPTNARWGIIYNNSDANKRCVAFVDLGAVKDLSATSLELRWSSVNGVGTIVTVTVS